MLNYVNTMSLDFVQQLVKSEKGNENNQATVTETSLTQGEKKTRVCFQPTRSLYIHSMLKYKFFTNHNSISNVLICPMLFFKFYQIDSFTTEFLLFKKYLNHYPTKCSETQVSIESQCAYTFIIIIMVVS